MSKKKGVAWAFSSHVTMQELWNRFSGDDYHRFIVDWLSKVYLIGFVLRSLLERRVLQQITWFKPNAQPNITGRLLTESTEYVLWACNNTPKKATKWTFNYRVAKSLNGGKQLRNMWSIPYIPKSAKIAGSHPTKKPLTLVERLVMIWTTPDDLVLDCFLGAGTTAIACAKLGRSWVAIESDKKSVAMTRKRLRLSS